MRPSNEPLWEDLLASCWRNGGSRCQLSLSTLDDTRKQRVVGPSVVKTVQTSWKRLERRCESTPGTYVG